MISSTSFKKKVDEEVDQVKENPLMISMNPEQQTRASNFINDITMLCMTCKGVFERYKVYQFENKFRVSPLPDSNCLIFDKNETLKRVRKDLQDVRNESLENMNNPGFIYSKRIIYTEKQLGVVQKTLEEIKPSNYKLEEFRKCQQIVGDSVKSLHEMKTSLDSNSSNVAWVFGNQFE